MGGTLFGETKSGTPVETRGATQAAGLSIEDLFRTGGVTGAATGIASPLQRLGTQAQTNLLSQQFGNQDLRSILGGALADPADRTQGLFAALEPFERRQTGQQVAGLRSAFGQQGGRFSSNLLDAEIRQRGELARQFDLARQQGLLQAGNIQAQNLGTALNALLGAQELGGRQGLQGLQTLLGFAAPGAAIQTEGLAPSLIQAGGTAAGAALLPAAASSREFKEGVTPLSKAEALQLFRFRYKGDPMERVGVIVEDDSTPPEWVVGGKYINLYEMLSLAIAAAGELGREVEALKKELGYAVA